MTALYFLITHIVLCFIGIIVGRDRFPDFVDKYGSYYFTALWLSFVLMVYFAIRLEQK